MRDVMSEYLALAERLIAIVFLASLLTAIAVNLFLNGDGMRQALGCNFSGRGVAVLETECRGFWGADAVAQVANVWLVPFVAIFIGLAQMQLPAALMSLLGVLVLVLVGLGTIGLCRDIHWVLRAFFRG